MFPVFPVLFPVCSQFPTNDFIVFPAFPLSAARVMSTFSYSPFLAHQEHWEQWELDGNGRTCSSSAVEQTWNDWELISAKRQSILVTVNTAVDHALQTSAANPVDPGFRIPTRIP